MRTYRHERLGASPHFDGQQVSVSFLSREGRRVYSSHFVSSAVRQRFVHPLFANAAQQLFPPSSCSFGQHLFSHVLLRLRILLASLS